MATAFDLGGLLGSSFGGGEFDDLLTPAQQEQIRNRGLLSAASALLQAGGPSRTPTSLGQALGAALSAQEAGTEKAQQSALTGMLTRQKLDEARREQQREQQFRQALLGFAGGGAGMPGQAMTADQAMAAPVTPELPAGPTVARAEMIGQAASAGMGSQAMPQLTPQQLTLISTLPRKEAAAELLKLTKPRSKPKKLGCFVSWDCNRLSKICAC